MKKRALLIVVALAGILFFGSILFFNNGIAGETVQSEGMADRTGMTAGSAGNVKNTAETLDGGEQVVLQERAGADDICPISGLPVGSGAGGMGRYFAGTMHETIASELGITTDELRAERFAGKSIAEIASEKGILPEKLQEEILKKRTAQLEELVKDGIITGEQKNVMEQHFKSRLETVLERDTVGPFNGRRPGRMQKNSMNGNNDEQLFRQNRYGHCFGGPYRYAN